MNLQGQAVGLSGDCSFEDATLRAVISERGKPVVDLNTLIPADSGVQLRNAVYINDRGEIAAVGALPDGNHLPVMLVPCHDDHRGDIDDRDDSSCRNRVRHPHPRHDRAASRHGSVPRFPSQRPNAPTN